MLRTLMPTRVVSSSRVSSSPGSSGCSLGSASASFMTLLTFATGLDGDSNSVTIERHGRVAPTPSSSWSRTMAEAFVYDHIRTPRGKGKAAGTLHEVKPVDLVVGLLDEIKDRNPG